MCLTSCSVAIEFSILRATSVSSCAGAAPGRLALSTTVGRSMSGKFCTFIRAKDSMPSRLSMMKRSTPGTGLRIDHAETFMVCASLLRRGCRRSCRELDRVAIVQEADTALDEAVAFGDSGKDLDAVAAAPAGRDADLRQLLVGADPEGVGETVPEEQRGLWQAERPV